MIYRLKKRRERERNTSFPSLACMLQLMFMCFSVAWSLGILFALKRGKREASSQFFEEFLP